ncbi:hypothetical protein [Trichodesmium erythraeum]|uniref:hypothetical protein n=1 Tax=Trichodesmium erythraeum TaxID=1206 RepID=UPI0003227885|nr:hypothetical protein [Trichodesmium erythraeum GBRTRLIN201]
MNKLIILVRGGSRLNFIDPNFFLVFLELPKKAIAHKAKTIFRTNSVSSLSLILTKPEQ